MPIWVKNKNTRKLGNDLCWQKRSSACKWCTSPVRFFVPHVRSYHFMSFRYVDYTGCNKSWTKLSIWSTHAIKQTMVLTISHLCIFSCSISIQFRVQIGCFNLFKRMPELSPLDLNTPQHAWNKFKPIQIQTCLKLKPFKPIPRSLIPRHLSIWTSSIYPQPPLNHQKKAAMFECSTYITKIKMQSFPRQETNNSSETHHIWCDFFRPREAIYA